MDYINKFAGEFNLEDVIAKTFQIVNDSFYICNLSDVIRKYKDWIKEMPRVKPHYAMKCNDDINVLKTLAVLGCSFDCASKGELKKILELKVAPDRVIFANTTKPSSHIEFAKQHKVHLMTFDNEDEIYKIQNIHPTADLVLRIRCSSQTAKYKLGKKFGSDPSIEAPSLLKLAKSFNLNVVGISFHVGSSNEDYDIYCEGIKISRKLFELAAEIGYNLNVLDIGGGFPGDTWKRISEFSSKINQALDEHFPIEKFPNLQILSEPGRYFVESAFTLVSQIHSRKVTRNENGGIEDVMYYLNEGIYSNFLFVPLGPEFVEPHVLKAKRSNEKVKATIWGPTCDSTDKVCEDIEIEFLGVGDILYFDNMGAYTISLKTNFNSFGTTKNIYFISNEDAYVNI